jgi:hypothetical protein
MSKQEKAEPEFTERHLLDNGLEALFAGAGLLKETSTERELGMALREIGSGIELVMKGFLATEHWSLVFDNPVKATRDAFRSGDFKSAGFDECVERLDRIVGLQISERCRKDLTRMREKRNRMEHLGVIDNLFALRAALGGALHAITNLAATAGHSGLLDDGRKFLHTELAIEFSNVDDFVKARWKEVSSQLPNGKGDPCTACGQDAAIFDDGSRCVFCGTHQEPSDAANEYIETVLGLSSYSTIKNGGEWPVYGCPECEDETMVDTGDATERYRCFSCDARFQDGELVRCSECNQLVHVDDEGDGLCSQCLRNKFSRDD